MLTKAKGDKVKGFIDNIAYMRNVSYDALNNIPDVFLKNLTSTLGLESINLFDETTLEEQIYNSQRQVYDGVSTGKNLIEAELEFYRRLLVNLAYIYKSKGTRQSLEFFLKFLGAPEPMIKINQYVYKVTSLPKSFDLNSDIYDVISGTKTYKTAIFLPTGGTINGVTYPLEDRFVLTGDFKDGTSNVSGEIALAKTATAAFNAIIAAKAQAKGWALVDMNKFFASLQAGMKFNGVTFGVTFVSGGLFSLDGVHGTQRGYAVVANEIIRAINLHYGSTIPVVDVNKYPGIKFP